MSGVGKNVIITRARDDEKTAKIVPRLETPFTRAASHDRPTQWEMILLKSLFTAKFLGLPWFWAFEFAATDRCQAL